MVQKKRIRKETPKDAPASDFIALLWTLRERKMITLEDMKRLEYSRDLIKLLEEKEYITRQDVDKNKEKVVETISVIMEVRDRKITGPGLFNILEKKLGYYYTRERMRDMAEMLGKLNESG